MKAPYTNLMLPNVQRAKVESKSQRHDFVTIPFIKMLPNVQRAKVESKSQPAV